jgi:septal ring factor EnvC (AmiA/AmiB activator)
VFRPGARDKEDALTGKIRIRRGLAAVLVALAVVLLAGCGTKASSSSATPSPSASQGSLAQLAALVAYLGQVKPIAAHLEATVTSLPEAVKGLAQKPDRTWTASATRLKTISSQLSSETKNLAALSPPELLRPLQDAAVKGIKDSQAAVAKTAAMLDKGVAKQGETTAQIQSQIGALDDRLSQLGQQLLSATKDVIASPNSTPTP